MCCVCECYRGEHSGDGCDFAATFYKYDLGKGDLFVLNWMELGGVCEMCMCLARGGVGGEGGEWMSGLDLGFTNPVGTGEVSDVCLCVDGGGVGGVGGEWVGDLDHGLEGCGGVMLVCVVSLDSLWRWQVQVSVYCAWRIPAHLMCTQCSIL